MEKIEMIRNYYKEIVKDESINSGFLIFRRQCHHLRQVFRQKR